MEKYLFLITCILLCISCDKDQFDKDEQTLLEKKSFSEGVYMGYFVLDNQNYWCEIVFNTKQYEEWPSGGAYYQKEMGCLTKGTYNINNSILTFDLNTYKFPSFPTPCDSKMILPGDYKIHLITLNDSLVFSKGIGENKIKYCLNRILK